MIKLAYVLAALLLSCSKNEVVDVAEPREPTQVTEKELEPCLPIEILPTKDSQGTANLAFDFPNTCVEVLVEGKEKRPLKKGESLAIAADELKLQRIVIGDSPVLLRLKPGTTQRISAHPEAGWQLEGDRFTNQDKSLVELVLPSAWTQGIRYTVPGESARSMPGPIDPPYTGLLSWIAPEVDPRTHQLIQVDTGAEVVGIALGAGEHWVLRVTPGGELFGSAKDR